MAGDWIKMRDDLYDDPAVISIGASTGLDEYGVVGRLHKLWSWADRHSLDGNALSVTSAWIDRYLSCDNFADSLFQAGWLTGMDGALSLPNFDRHNGETAKKRAQTNKRVAEHREKQRNGNADSVTHNVTESVTREEKRREEETTHTPGMAAQISIVLRRYQIGANPSHPSVIALAEQGVDLETLEACCKETRESKPNESISIGYVLKKLEGWKAQAKAISVQGVAKAKKVDTWFLSVDGMNSKARELGISGARMGETEAAFKSRIQQAINAREAA